MLLAERPLLNKALLRFGLLALGLLGLTGFAAVGKTTVFTALTGLAPRPERTAQVGVIKVPDARVDALAGIWKPRKTS